MYVSCPPPTTDNNATNLDVCLGLGGEPMDAPHLAEHRSVAEREPDGEQPHSRLTDGSVRFRADKLAVQTEQEDRPETDAAAEQHDGVTHGVGRLDHSVDKQSINQSINRQNVDFHIASFCGRAAAEKMGAC
jgi:hypothetical protein